MIGQAHAGGPRTCPATARSAVALYCRVPSACGGCRRRRRRIRTSGRSRARPLPKTLCALLPLPPPAPGRPRRAASRRAAKPAALGSKCNEAYCRGSDDAKPSVPLQVAQCGAADHLSAARRSLGGVPRHLRAHRIFYDPRHLRTEPRHPQQSRQAGMPGSRRRRPLLRNSPTPTPPFPRVLLRQRA